MTHDHLDYKLPESRMKLRKLELEAYSSLVSAFRAQGNFSKEKKKILNELRSFLSITLERHQAEIRRAVNDEKLSKISLSLNGEDPLDTWVIEGRRIIPLLKRMPPKTGVSSVADKVARLQVKRNESEKMNKTELNNILNNNEASRKRSNSTESVNILKRKFQPIQIKSTNQQLNIQDNQQNKIKCSSPILSTITIPTSTLSSISNSFSSTAKNDCAKLNPQTPKLLIMSTSSMTMNKPIVNTTDCQQLINVNKIDLDESKLLSLTETNAIPVSQFLTNSSSAKVYNPKLVQSSSTSPKLMILPNSNQTKTLTIPISHKTLQIPSSNSTILYSTTQQPIVSSTSNTIKTIPGITIQAIKTTQGQKSNNFIIMPNKSNNNSGNATAGAKGLLRQMNAKEFPLKFISTTTPANKQITKKNQQNDKTNDINQLDDTNNERQVPPTIILTTTNVCNEKGNNLTGSNSQIRNLIKNNQGNHPNIIKVIPKCSTAPNLLQNSKINSSNKQTSPITIPAGTNATTFMEILKNIPISRISPLSSDGSKTTINITQNPASGSSYTKKIQIPQNATTESITKLIFTNVMSSNNLNKINLVQSGGTPVNPVASSIDTAKKVSLIPKNSNSNLSTSSSNLKTISNANITNSIASMDASSTLNAQSIENKEQTIKDKNNECPQKDKTEKSLNE